MKNGYKAMDSDMHVMEPCDLWQKYIDKKYLDRAPIGTNRFKRDLGVQVEGKTMPRPTPKPNRDWAEKDRETLVRYLRAWLKGLGWARDQANREAAAKIIGAELNLNPKQAAERVGELSATGNLNIAGLQVVLDLRNQFGFKLLKGDKLPAYVDAQFIDAAKRR